MGFEEVQNVRLLRVGLLEPVEGLFVSSSTAMFPPEAEAISFVRNVCGDDLKIANARMK